MKTISYANPTIPPYCWPASQEGLRLRAASASLEITEQLSKFPRQLSGGQRQRVACARALITEPALILDDEPTGARDSANSKSLMQTFAVMNKKLGSTILMVTHDALATLLCFSVAMAKVSLGEKIYSDRSVEKDCPYYLMAMFALSEDHGSER